jgi:PAS domain S-box-containing protein
MSDSLRVALIDDNESDRALIKRELVRAFENPQFIEIIDRAGFDRLFAQDGYDVLITDYAFGWGNGLEALRASKARYPDKPVIMFTATANEETAVEAMKSGLDDYIVKGPKRYVRIPAAIRMAMHHAAVSASRQIAEERLRSTLLELHEQREWLSTTLKSISSAVVATDKDGAVRFINPAAERLTGWNSDAARGKDIDEVVRLLTPSGEPVPAGPAKLALRGEASAGEQHDFTLIGRSGRRIAIVDGASPIRAEDGAILGSVMVFRDITERKHMMEELARSNEELQQFTYAAAHDLREPVRTVRSFTELLELEHANELQGNGRQLLSYVSNAARRMEELVDALFQYGQASSDDPQVTDVSPDEVLKVVTGSMRKQIEDNHATVEWNGLPVVRADRNQIAAVFQNLISNAVKYRGSTPPHVQILGDDSDPAEWRFCVADNGIGIAPRHQSRVFDIFERLHPDRYPGAGIGLAICRRVVERHGGRIWVESEEGGGSTFCFTLPKPE